MIHIEKQPRILLVEDEVSIRDTIKLNLELEGYEVVTTGNGKDALKLTKDQYFDLLLLDVMLPEVDGFQICEQVRLTNTEVGIIFLTAKDSQQDKIIGLKKGGDDYLVKPFNLEELLLRVSKLIVRSAKHQTHVSDLYEFGKNKINFTNYEALGVNGEFVLTKKEAMLLKLLIERKNEVVSRQQILQSVWGYDVYPSTRTIDNFILSFRKYFEEDQKNPRYFHSIRGVGYKFIE
ncbi:MAG: response regulator transcription factor [Saprospiraceae bacterium]|nr:response regulator transcription factor [Saprospiraceae bacterium]